MRLNHNLEAMAQAIYDYWFVQFDFPDESGKPYKSSGGKMVWSNELKREIPADWEAGLLSSIIHVNPTESLKKGCNAPYIAMEALSTTDYLTDVPTLKQYVGGMKFRNNDVLIARITPCLENGKTALVHDLNTNEIGFGSTEFIILRGKYFSQPAFCITLARSVEFRQYAISKMTGTSGRRRLDYKDVCIYKLAVPPGVLLKRYEAAIASLLDRMHRIHVQNHLLSKQRDFLLPLLMNGQVTVTPQGEELNYDLIPFFQMVLVCGKAYNRANIMKEKIIECLEREMQNILTISQIKALRGAAEKILAGVRIEIDYYYQNDNCCENLGVENAFISSKRLEGCSEKTLAYYHSTLCRFLHAIEKPIRLMTTSDIREYLVVRQKEGNLSKVTMDNIRRIFSSFFSWLEDEDYIPKSPVRRIRKVQQIRSSKKC